MKRRLLSSEILWGSLGVMLALAWFTPTILLPSVYRGMLCCDAADYLRGAGSAKLEQVMEPSDSSVSDTTTETTVETPSTGKISGLVRLIFTDAGYRPLGYPAFLAIHKYALRMIGITSQILWVNAAAISALVIHLLAGFFFYRTARRAYPLHPAALMLLLAHPGLTSHAALPLSDGLAVSLMLLALCCVFRALEDRTRNAWAWTAAGGFLLATLIWVRAPHLMAVMLFLAAWIAVMLISRSWRGLLLACAAAAVTGILLSPRVIACSNASGTFCFTLPALAATQQHILLELGLRNVRAYTVAGPEREARLEIVDDPWLTSLLGRHCPIGETTATRDVALCFLRRPHLLPLFYGKKLIGLFDNYHWQTYATLMTPVPVMFMNRVVDELAFAGFVLMIIAAVMMVWRKFRHFSKPKPQPAKGPERSRGEPVLVVLLYPLAYLAYTALLPVESRYGLPLAPFGLMMVGALWTMPPRRIRRYALIGLLLLVILFAAQVLAWDRIPPVVYAS